MIIVIYRDPREEMHVFAFESTETVYSVELADAKVIELVGADFPQIKISTMEDVRDLEALENFAIDLFMTNPNKPECDPVDG